MERVAPPKGRLSSPLLRNSGRHRRYLRWREPDTASAASICRGALPLSCPAMRDHGPAISGWRARRMPVVGPPTKNREPQPPVCKKGRPKAASQIQTMQVRKYVVPLPQAEDIVSFLPQKPDALRQTAAEHRFLRPAPGKEAFPGASSPGNVPLR